MSVFSFKQFQIKQDQCAMKVGTDGVLLGAWARSTAASKLLDIGTGTGLLALMTAQRNAKCFITAVEVDHKAAMQAIENVQASTFSQRIRVLESDISSLESQEKYDFIISNPPFFNGSFQPDNQQRSLARHYVNLDLARLLHVAKNLGTQDHTLALIYPFDSFRSQQFLVEQAGYNVTRACLIKPTPQKKPHRIMLELSLSKPDKVEEAEISIELSRHQYTEEYKSLCRDFYLAM